MKILNKKLMLLMMGIIVMLLALLTGKVQAASQEFGLQEYRKPVGSTQYGYKVSDKYVWKIVTYSGSAINYDRTLYCLKAEQGFYTAEPGTFKETYDLSYDFMNKNSMSPLPVPSQYYNQIVWILNHAYIPNASTASTDKATLLQNAGVTNSELTDDDIDVVQQLAIWYFTNYDDPTYHTDMQGEASFQTVLQSTKTSGGTSEYKAIEDINQTRYDQMDKLFVYLVENAKKATESSNSTSSPISMGNTTPTVEVNGSNYIVISFLFMFMINLFMCYKLCYKYTLLVSNQSQTSQTLEQLIGSNFYLRIPISTVNSENITSLRFSMNGNYTITTATYWTKSGDSTVQPIVELGRTPKTFSGNKEVTFPKEGSYNLKLVKVEQGNTTKKLQGATFKITSPNGTVTETTSSNGEINVGPIIINTPGTDTITIEETKAPDGYEKIITSPINVQVTKVFENNTYKMSDAKITNAQTGASINLSGNTITVTVENRAKYFDLALRKYITQLNGENVDNTRAPVIDTSSLTTGTTESYNHRKDPVAVTTGDKVIYNLTIYNEGQKPGRATKIQDQLPTGLVFNRVVSGNFELDSYSETDNLLKLKRTSNTDNLNAYNGTTLDSETIQIECTVTAVPTYKEQILTNVAWISEEYDAESNVTITNEENADRDSIPGTHPDVNKDNMEDYTGNNNQEDLADEDYYFKGQEDDDDFEKLKVVYFDLALRKFITGKNDATLIGREPQVDVTNLADGTSTTATYNHPKNPIDMQRGDIVIYTIRVYNEGSMDGYANEITDYLPEELEFLPDHEINQEYEWQVSSDGRHVTTDYLSKDKETSSRQNLLKAFDGTILAYKDVKIACKIKDTAEVGKKLTNLAEITESKDSEGNDVVDRDSETDNVEVPTDEDLPNYKDDEIDKDYVPGQEDDDDFEKVKVVYFDLALRKFITAVDDTEITNRIPQLSMGEDGNIHYDHTKDPVEVENGNIVTYTLRIYNEGLMSGYASKVKDDVPDGLEFLPDNEINQEYRWVLSEDGTSIETDYLSKEQEQTEGSNLIKAFDPELGITDTNPDYRDLKIAFRVTEPNTSDRILVNTAEISDDRDENNDPIDDIDSTPDNNNEWNEEDDLDKEFIKVKYFDLALKKWVSRAIVTNQDGSQNIIETGHTGDENPEPPAKVDLGRQDINKVVVKFEFQIKITNEGEIAGYATEVTDYIPEGLKFIQEDNPLWYPREPLNGKERVGTQQLANTLLQPGESATISILLTWINDPNNMGLKTNIAEISQDDNDSDTPDIDSTPDNFTDGEDDIDDAPVMLTVALGDTKIYIGLGFVVVAMLTGGIWAIKRYVL